MFDVRITPGLLERLLGGSFSIVGDELTKLTERGVGNLKRRRQLARILRSLRDKTRPSDDAPVNPRALKDAIESGTYSSDELVAEYHGGILASSRTKVDKDDTAAFYSALIRGLAAEQLRAHWILYSVLFTHSRGRKNVNVYREGVRDSLALLIPWRIFLFLFQCLDDDEMRGKYSFEFLEKDKAASKFSVDEDIARSIGRFEYNVMMSLTSGEKEIFREEGFVAGSGCSSELLRRLDVAFWGLLKEELVDPILWGPQSIPLGEPVKEGIAFKPSVSGIDLFLRAQGIRPTSLLSDCFESLTFRFEPETLENAILQDVMEVTIQDDGRSSGRKARVVPRSKAPNWGTAAPDSFGPR